MTNGEKIKEIFPSIEIVAIVPNEIVATKKLDGDGEYTRHSFSYEWWNAEYKEPTTKNDLGVDLISRADAINCLVGQIELNPSDVPAVNEYLKGVDKRLHKLPSVTPQEPILDKIRVEIQNGIHHFLDGEPIIEIKEVLQILDNYKTESE